MESAFSGEYQLTTLRLIDNSLEKCIKNSIELVFLSIIDSTIAKLDNEDVDYVLEL